MGYHITSLGNQKLEEMMKTILNGTNLQYKKESKAIATYAGRTYFRLFVDENKVKTSYDENYGIWMETSYDDGKINVIAELSRIGSYTVNYINGGSKNFGQFDKIQRFEKSVEIDKSKIIDIGEVDNRKYNRSGMWGHSVDSTAFLKDYPNNVTIGYGAWSAISIKHIEELLNPIFDEVLDFFKEQVSKIENNLFEDNILNHLGEFKRLEKTTLERLSKTYEKCYYSMRDGTPKFENLTKTADYIKKMSTPYGTIMGFRSYLEWDGNLYLWFGADEVCSLWC